MPLPTRRWQLPAPLPAEVESNLQPYPPIIRQILFNRDLTTLEAAVRFLEAKLPPGAEPENLLGMQAAVERIAAAIQNREAVAIYGDYDADGVTATALLAQALEQLGANVQPYIPHRFDEGYGIHNLALDGLHAAGVRLVITVDCGIRSNPEAAHAHGLGLDLIITDHHQPGPEMPVATAVINPRQDGCTYVDKNLAGVGLAYMLAAALFAHCRGSRAPADQFLDLVALGTVADLAPLSEVNRALVRRGLQQMRQPHRQGLLSLIQTAGLKPDTITATDISFGLAPRLNAAGRLDSALAALTLLTTHEVTIAGELAQKLEVQNRERQALTHSIQEHAEAQVLARDPQALLLFAAHPDYNSGVVGLAASRLVDRFYRPAVVAQQGEQSTRGSCRSIPEFHITEALDECAELLEHHGGHAAAAGFTVRNENLPALQERLKAIAARKLSGLELRPTLTADVVAPLHEVRPELLYFLDQLQPCGQQNPPAMFVSQDLKVTSSRPVGKDNAHLKLVVTDGRVTYDAIAFRQGHWHGQLPPRIDLMYTYERNEFNGRSSLQLNVKDLRPATLQNDI